MVLQEIIVLFVLCIVYILIFVIPRFVAIYASMDSAQMPAFTSFIISLSNFLEKNILILFAVLVLFILIFLLLYNNIKMFKTLIQWLLMHLPLINQVIIYNEVSIFTKTLSSLLSQNVLNPGTMELLKKNTNNEIYKMIIFDATTNLSNGDKISEALKNRWAFPLSAYEMIVTGEKTGELPEMMAKVADYYQKLHAKSVARIKTIIIIFFTVVVGGIVLSIVVPMFNMYSTLQG